MPEQTPPVQDPRETLSDPAVYPISPRVVGDPTQPRPTDPNADFAPHAELISDRTVLLTTYGSSSCPATVVDAFVVSDEGHDSDAIASDHGNQAWIELETKDYTNQGCTADMGPHATELDIPEDAPMPTEIRNDLWEEPLPIMTLRILR